MTNEEAKTFLDNLKVCIEEHPIVADWLVEIADRKTEPQIDDFFREPTAEERKAVAEYIESISIPTGVNIFDLMDEPQANTHDIRTETHECVKDTHDKSEPQTGVSYSDHTDYEEPKTYVTWTEPQTEEGER